MSKRINRFNYCTGPTVKGTRHESAKPVWLEIDKEMKQRPEYWWGWYCPVCYRILSKPGG